MEFDELSERVIGCAIEVHRGLGPELLESTYEQCLAHELNLSGLEFKLQHPLPVEYKGVPRPRTACYTRSSEWLANSCHKDLHVIFHDSLIVGDQGHFLP